jgi:uncharacterized protein (TIGR02246 family)
MKHLRPLACAALAALLSAPAVHAQALPGLVPSEPAGNAPSMYVLRVKQEVTGMIGAFKQAWDRHDADAAAALYTRDARMVSGGQEIQDRAAIREHIAGLLATAGPLRFSVLDFDTSGEMAFVSGQMSFDAATPGGHAQDYVLVARRGRGDRWLIRALLLTPLEAEPAPTAATPASAPPGAE